jgi:hypothetical protein
MTLDEFTQTLDPALGLVQSNFGMLTGDQRIAGQDWLEQPSWTQGNTRRCATYISGSTSTSHTAA